MVQKRVGVLEKLKYIAVINHQGAILTKLKTGEMMITGEVHTDVLKIMKKMVLRNVQETELVLPMVGAKDHQAVMMRVQVQQLHNHLFKS